MLFFNTSMYLYRFIEYDISVFTFLYLSVSTSYLFYNKISGLFVPIHANCVLNWHIEINSDKKHNIDVSPALMVIFDFMQNLKTCKLRKLPCKYIL